MSMQGGWTRPRGDGSATIMSPPRSRAQSEPWIARELWRLNQRFRLYTPAIREFCFIVGAMKSGTTTLYAYLAQHPEIAENHQGKEPEFFSATEPPTDLDGYRRQWLPRPFVRRIALEASTGYAKVPTFPNVAQRLAALPQKKHVVFIMRDPLERVESHIAHGVEQGRIAEPERLGDDATGRRGLGHLAVVSKYASQLDAYRAAMPDVEPTLIDFARFRDDPAAVLAALCRALEIDDRFAFQPLPAMNARRSTTRFRLTDAQRASLRNMLAADMAALRDRYGVDVAAWGF